MTVYLLAEILLIVLACLLSFVAGGALVWWRMTDGRSEWKH
jgi:hypothetical protein